MKNSIRLYLTAPLLEAVFCLRTIPSACLSDCPFRPLPTGFSPYENARPFSQRSRRAFFVDAIRRRLTSLPIMVERDLLEPLEDALDVLIDDLPIAVGDTTPDMGRDCHGQVERLCERADLQQPLF